jgi:hypothetical protein
MRTAPPDPENSSIKLKGTADARITWILRAAALLPSLFLLSACALLFGRPEPGILIREKTSVCFRQSEDAHILVSVQPGDCYSIRCTHVNQAIGTAVLDQTNFRLDLETTFNLSSTRPLIGGCSPDCAGGGRLEFNLGRPNPGLYTVNLWGHKIGELSVTSGLPWHDQCLPE